MEKNLHKAFQEYIENYDFTKKNPEAEDAIYIAQTAMAEMNKAYENAITLTIAGFDSVLKDMTEHIEKCKELDNIDPTVADIIMALIDHRILPIVSHLTEEEKNKTVKALVNLKDKE